TVQPLHHDQSAHGSRPYDIAGDPFPTPTRSRPRPGRATGVTRRRTAGRRVGRTGRVVLDGGMTKPEIEFPTGPAPADLTIRDITVGDGDEATPGARVTVHYLGVEFESGEEF